MPSRDYRIARWRYVSIRSIAKVGESAMLEQPRSRFPKVGKTSSTEFRLVEVAAKSMRSVNLLKVACKYKKKHVHSAKLGFVEAHEVEACMIHVL